jgi:hypothetical protein
VTLAPISSLRDARSKDPSQVAEGQSGGGIWKRELPRASKTDSRSPFLPAGSSAPGLVTVAAVGLSRLVRKLAAVVHSRGEKVAARGPVTRGDFLRSLWK